MNKKITLAIAAVLMVTVLLTGCQLAKADGDAAENARLVGVFLTTEYLDLFDFESYFEDNISKALNGGEVPMADTERYGGRVYAELVEKPYTSEETGETHSIWDYVFTELDGIPFFKAEVTDPNGLNFIGTFTDGTISDMHFATGNENTTLEGTLYVMPNGFNAVYVNPVYQSSDGRVFVTSGNGISTSGNSSEGAMMSTTLTETHSKNENGEETSEYFEVTLHVSVKNRPESIRIIQMDAQSAVADREEYHPDSLPGQIKVHPETEYIILETQAASPNGETTFSRVLIDDAESYITAYAARPDGIIAPRGIELIWEAAQ